jgi:hypothetical protein
VWFSMLVGSKVSVLIWRCPTTAAKDLIVLTSLFFGVLIHGVGVGALLLIYPNAIKYLPWVLLAYVVLDWRRTADFIKISRCALVVVGSYGLVCFAILLFFNAGALPGDNLFWSIYKLTHVTPGDSPQGLFQAQYLLHGIDLTGASNFAIFDRPFFGGLISVGVLEAVGLGLGATFDSYSKIEIYVYVALWVWLNATFALGLISLLKQFAKGSSVYVAGILVLASPFVVFNTIGTWPKLFALYVLCCAALLAINRYWKLAVLLSGFSFFIHGSFLWPHISLCGILALYLLSRPGSLPLRIRESLVCFAMGLIFPILWFVAQKISGSPSPLAMYYLYAASVTSGFHNSAAVVASRFYQATTPANVALLPFINIIKSIIPLEILRWVINFSVSGAAVSMRGFADVLFFNQFYRPLFAFGLIGSMVALSGLRRELLVTRWLTLALATFFILPLIPGMLIYRNDDLFIMPIMTFCLIPLSAAFCVGLSRLKLIKRVAVVCLMISEFGLVYWSRYNGVNYYNEYYGYYEGVVLIALFGVLFSAFYYMRTLDDSTGAENV